MCCCHFNNICVERTTKPNTLSRHFVIIKSKITITSDSLVQCTFRGLSLCELCLFLSFAHCIEKAFLILDIILMQVFKFLQQLILGEQGNCTSTKMSDLQWLIIMHP